MGSKANKRRKLADDDVNKMSGSSSEGEQEDNADDQTSESVDSAEGDEVIQVDFEAFPFKEEDVERVERFLETLIPDAKENGLDLTKISQIVVKQSGIGCVLMPTAEEMDEDEEEVFGMISVIDMDACSQLKSYCRLRLAQASKSTKEKFETALNGSKTGFIICERLINMPIDVALPSYKSLKQDIESASVKYNFFMLLLKCQRVSAAKESTRSEEIFVNSEDEFWFQLSSASCDLPIHSTHGTAETSTEDDEENVENFRRLIIVHAEKMDEFLTKLQN